MEQSIAAAEKSVTHAGGQTCPYKEVHDLQWASLREDLGELKTRVQHLETTLARGLTLLIANLAGVIVSLLRQLV